jgi:hypothetical protein
VIYAKRRFCLLKRPPTVITVAVLAANVTYTRRRKRQITKNRGHVIAASVRSACASRPSPSPSYPATSAARISRSFLRHPGFAQAVVDPLVTLGASGAAALWGVVRLPCRDRLEGPGGGQREVALQRLARFGVTTGQGERCHKGSMNILDIIRIDRDRLAGQFNRLKLFAHAFGNSQPCSKLTMSHDAANSVYSIKPFKATNCMARHWGQSALVIITSPSGFPSLSAYT